MTRIDVHRAPEPGAKLVFERRLTEEHALRDCLAELGVGFERWRATAPLALGAGQPEVLAAYRADVDRLMARGGYQSVDVVRMHPEHPEREAFRKKFLEEHIHTDDEVRFFVEGAGAFYIRDPAAERVVQIVAEAGDLLVVPANTRHWFDMGPRPYFAAIRLFITPAGWVANFTGDDIARRTPYYEP